MYVEQTCLIWFKHVLFMKKRIVHGIEWNEPLSTFFLSFVLIESIIFHNSNYIWMLFFGRCDMFAR